jgi:urease
VPSNDIFPAVVPEAYLPEKKAGAVIALKTTEKIVLAEGRKRIKLRVTSKGDRPIQVRYDS